MNSKMKTAFSQHKFCVIVLAAFSMLTFATESEAPSMEFLEFLAEFNDIDDDDFALLVFHALDDSDKNNKEAALPVVEEKDEE